MPKNISCKKLQIYFSVDPNFNSSLKRLEMLEMLFLSHRIGLVVAMFVRCHLLFVVCPLPMRFSQGSKAVSHHGISTLKNENKKMYIIWTVSIPNPPPLSGGDNGKDNDGVIFSPFFGASRNKNIDATIRIGREIWCLLYAGFFQ